MARVLVVGVPRSGTTWVAEVLGTAPNVGVVQEPDNERANPQAAPMVRARGVYPIVAPYDTAPDYARLWDLAFEGGWPVRGPLLSIGRRVRQLPPRVLDPLLTALAAVVRRTRPRPQHVVVKTVTGLFSLDWISNRYHPIVVVVERDLLNVVASWLDVGIRINNLESDEVAERFVRPMDLPAADPAAAMHVRVAWCVGMLSTVLRETAQRHKGWLAVSHERLCADPLASFGRLFTSLGLEMTANVAEGIRASDQEGSGYETRRVREQLPEAWRRRLDAKQADAVRRTLSDFSTAVV